MYDTLYNIYVYNNTIISIKTKQQSKAWESKSALNSGNLFGAHDTIHSLSPRVNAGSRSVVWLERGFCACCPGRGQGLVFQLLQDPGQAPRECWWLNHLSWHLGTCSCWVGACGSQAFPWILAHLFLVNSGSTCGSLWFSPGAGGVSSGPQGRRAFNASLCSQSRRGLCLLMRYCVCSQWDCCGVPGVWIRMEFSFHSTPSLTFRAVLGVLLEGCLKASQLQGLLCTAQPGYTTLAWQGNGMWAAVTKRWNIKKMEIETSMSHRDTFFYRFSPP